MDAIVGQQIVRDNTCGECGSVLVLPWIACLYCTGETGVDYLLYKAPGLPCEACDGARGKHQVRCLKDKSHTSIRPKNRTTRFLANNVEVDILTQKEVDLDRYANKTEQEMAKKVQNAIAIGTFPQNTTPEQVVALSRVAAAYGLDPLMQELIPYQGKPYITIAGRRRLDNAAGYRPSIRFRFLTEDEERGYKAAGALDDGDLVQICILTESGGRNVEGLGRSLGSEVKSGGSAQTPQTMRRIEMAQKRAERRAREMAYGPVPMPAGLDVPVMEEGDETNTVEGAARVVDEETGEIDGEEVLDAAVGPSASVAPPIDPPAPPKPEPRPRRTGDTLASLVEDPDTGDMFPAEH